MSLGTDPQVLPSPSTRTPIVRRRVYLSQLEERALPDQRLSRDAARVGLDPIRKFTRRSTRETALLCQPPRELYDAPRRELRCQRRT
jgi:hypothetical protein